MTCPYAHDDGAYVLGALSPADRAAFEAHLPGCPSCREAVASLAVLPGLLGRLTADEADAVHAEAGVVAGRVPPEVLPRVLAAAAAQRRRELRTRHWRTFAAAAAAAVLAAIVGLSVHAFDGRPDNPGVNQAGPTPTSLPLPPVSMRPMTPVSSAVPVVAELGLRPTPEGTRVEMTCGYMSEYAGTWTLHLFVWPKSGGDPERIATWTAKAGDEMRVSASTQYTPAQIDHVEVRGGSGRTLLTWTPA